LDELTRTTLGKPSLYIAVEEGEGGGAATIRGMNIPLVIPRDYADLYRILGLVRNSKDYGGIIIDSASECSKKHVKNAALKYPCRENVATREAGVATRSDFQVMGELMSQVLRMAISCTTHENPEFRKHLIVTAADRMREEDGRVTYQGPDLAGRMGSEAVQIFQQVFTMEIRPVVTAGKRANVRYLITESSGVRAAKDRYHILPEAIRLKSSPTDGDGENLLSMWQKYYVPAMVTA